MPEQEALLPVSAARLGELEKATAAYQDQITLEAAQWLLARGIDPATANGFRLGVVRDPVPGHERFKGFLSIPYLTANDAPLSMRFRCLTEHDHREHHHGKYMSMTDEPARVFNVAAIVNNRTDELHITEGEFDAMILTKIGLPAIAIPGAQAWRPHHRRMVAGFNRVWVWGDPDEAGAEFNGKVTRSVRSATAVPLSRSGGDVTAIFQAGGAAAVMACLDGGA